MVRYRTCSSVSGRYVLFFLLRGISPRFQRVARWGVARPAFRRTANDLPLSCVDATRIHSLISGGCTGEIAPMEKRIDMHVDLLRREEFRGVECVSDVAKSAVPFIRGEDLNYNPIGPARNFITSARPLPGSTSVLERGNWGTRCRLITTSTFSLRRLGWSRLLSRLRRRKMVS